MFEIVSVCNGGGYRYCRTSPLHPKANAKGLYPLHRVLMENKLGRLLARDEHVHHKSGNKADDEADNLEVLSISDHAAHHAVAAETIECVCLCGRTFNLTARVLRKRLKYNLSARAYCSRSCGTTYS